MTLTNDSKSSKPQVLLAPVHYVINSDHAGSEIGWAFSIYSRLSASKDIHANFITGGTNNLKDRRIINEGIFNTSKLNQSIINVIRFHLCTFIKTIIFYSRCRTKKNLVLHHVLPFTIGKSFNPFSLLFNTPFIVGPIQSSLSVVDTDLYKFDSNDYSTNTKISLLQNIEEVMVKTIRPVISRLCDMTLKKAKAIIVINDTTKDLLIKRGIPSGKIHVIPPGVDTKLYKPSGENKYSNGNRITFITACKLLQRKRVDVLVEAVNIVRKKYKNFQLIIVGDGKQKPYLESLVEKYKINDYVKFTGFVSNRVMPKYYQNADVFLFSSISEGFATVSLEAVASGLAILSTPVGGFSEVVKEGVNGHIIKSNTPEEFAIKMVDLLLNPNKLLSFKKNSRQIALSQYDWDMIIIPEYKNIYRSCLPG